MAVVRRHLIIEPKFQAGFVFAFVRGVLLAVAIPASFTFLALQIIAKNPSLTDAQSLAITGLTQNLAAFFVLICGVLGAVSALVGLVLSHRYAGPLKRVESWSARHLLGEPVEDLVLRPGDELAPVADALARIMARERKQ